MVNRLLAAAVMVGTLVVALPRGAGACTCVGPVLACNQYGKTNAASETFVISPSGARGSW